MTAPTDQHGYISARSLEVIDQIHRMAEQHSLPLEVEAEAYVYAALCVLHEQLRARGELEMMRPFIEHRLAVVLATGQPQ
jgi:hypothetical protein